MRLRLDAAFFALSLAALVAVGAAGEALRQDSSGKRISPDWMTVDRENRRVTLQITAALTTANSGWNFNGYANGEMTIAVPLDWRVEIRFTSRDANYPHSVGIVEMADEIPVSGEGVAFAFPRAFSLKFSRGLFGLKEDKFGFKADRVGRFWLFCGVPTHARGGMWDYFVVSDEISEPYVEITKKEK